jgi:hypothetical protein
MKHLLFIRELTHRHMAAICQKYLPQGNRSPAKGQTSRF